MEKIKLLLSGKTKMDFYVDAAQRLGAETYGGYLPDVDTSYDGLVRCGGGDVDPKYY